MNIEQESLQFIHMLKEQYFKKRDLSALLQNLEQGITWLGTGTEEMGHDFQEARTVLKKDLEEYKGSFSITKESFWAQACTDTICIVYGSLCARAQDGLVGDLLLHITAVCEKGKEGMKLLHCNISRPDTELEQGRCYVPGTVRRENSNLRSEFAIREKQLENISRNLPGGAHQCENNDQLTLTGMSDGFLSMFGYTREEIHSLFQDSYLKMIYPEDRVGILSQMKEQLVQGPDIELEYRVMCKNGSLMWILDKSRLLDDGIRKESGDTVQSFYCILIEMNDRKKAQEELRLSLERHQVILDQATDIIFEWDMQEDTLLFSHNWRKKFGYDPIRGNISNLIPFSSNIHEEDKAAFVKIMKECRDGKPYSETEFRILNSTNEFIWCRIRATLQFDSYGLPIKAIGVITDITAERQEKQTLLEMAQRDGLTGLYNKAVARTLVEKCMGEDVGKLFQVLYIIDVDNFKSVNDKYGHLCGDSVLSDVANTLKKHFRSRDIIGRIGGDEFLVYLPEVKDEEAAHGKARKVLEAICAITPMKGAEPISCSIGAAVSAQGEIDYFTLYDNADKALYVQKNKGKKGISFYQDIRKGTDHSDGLAHTAVSIDIDSEKRSAVDEKLAQYVFRMLYHSIDIETAVNHLLQIVGQFFDVSRAYIFENSEDGKYCNNTFEWCAPGIQPELDVLQNISYEEDLPDYFYNFNEDGVFYCEDISKLPEHLFLLLRPQGICSLLQCAILDGGRLRGYVGFDDCRENRRWTKQQAEALELVSNVLSVFLMKHRTDEQVKRLMKDIK